MSNCVASFDIVSIHCRLFCVNAHYSIPYIHQISRRWKSNARWRVRPALKPSELRSAKGRYGSETCNASIQCVATNISSKFC